MLVSLESLDRTRQNLCHIILFIFKKTYFNVKYVAPFLETYEPSEQLQLQQPHHSNSSEKSPGKLHLTQDPTANAGLLAPLLDTVPPISAQIPPPFAAPVQEMAEPTFQTAGDVAPITVPDSSLQIKREAVSPKLREDCMNVPEQSTSRSPQAELHLQDSMLVYCILKIR